MTEENITKLAIFQKKEIRKTIYKDEWWFSIIDVIEVLTETTRARKYWSDLKKKIEDEGQFQLSEEIGQLKLLANDGKNRKTDCANTETLFRIIQSIPSPKAEPFKRWLARVGYERIKEIEDPELATKRTRALFRAKGYSDGWIEKRIRGIAIREELTDEWGKRGIKEQRDYAILTAEISKATFDMTPSEYKKYKKLKKENLRDHMTDLELIFSMLGERATTEITQVNNSAGFDKLKDDAGEGGQIAGDAREALEKKTKKRVVTKGNFLKKTENKKQLEE